MSKGEDDEELYKHYDSLSNEKLRAEYNAAEKMNSDLDLKNPINQDNRRHMRVMSKVARNGGISITEGVLK